jgi:acetolactate synthase-1/2/3 large subunit
MAMHLNRAVAEHRELKPVYCQHEQACVAAAEGYAMAANFRNAGFAVVTAGPGVSNTITSLLSAYADSTPLVVLAGQIKTADVDRFSTRTHGVQEIRSRALVTPCVKRFLTLKATGFREAMIEVLAEAFAGRPGPVFVEIPLDVQATRLTYTESDIANDAECVRLRVASVPGEDIRKITTCLGLLLKSRKPLLYVGNGCRIAGVEQAVCDFIARYHIPAVFSWLSFDILPSSNPLHFGCPGGLAPISSNEILGAADTVVFLGARLDLGTTAFQRETFGGQATRYFVDVDPSELAKFKGFERTTCVQADLRALPAAIAHGLLDAEISAEDSWLPWCTDRRDRYLAEERRRLTSDRLNVYGIAQRLSQWSDGKVVVPASSGYAEETFTRFFVPGNGTRFFNGAGLGSMGLGLSHAIGASFATERQVFCLEADGGLMLNLQEIATLVQYGPKGFVLFVLNNGGYESIRVSQMHHFGAVSGVDRDSGVYLPDFAKIADAFGIRYILVETPDALDSLLPRLSADATPIFIDLKIDRFEYRGPAVKTMMGEDGKPFSTPLSEMTW